MKIIRLNRAASTVLIAVFEIVGEEPFRFKNAACEVNLSITSERTGQISRSTGTTDVPRYIDDTLVRFECLSRGEGAGSEIQFITYEGKAFTLIKGTSLTATMKMVEIEDKEAEGALEVSEEEDDDAEDSSPSV